MKVIRFIFSLPFAVVLLALGIAAGALFSVRTAYSEEKITEYVKSIRWAEVEIVQEEETATLYELFNESMTSYGLGEISVEKFDKVLTSAGVDVLTSELAGDLSSWFFNDGPRPVLDANQISEAIVSGAVELIFGSDPSESPVSTEEEGIFSDLGNSEFLQEIKDGLMDEIATLVGNLSEIEAIAENFDTLLDEIEPYRAMLSSRVLMILLAAVCIAILILLLINRRSNSLGLTYIGSVSVLDGLVFFVLSRAVSLIPDELFAEYAIPESTLALVVDPLISTFATIGTVLAAGGGCVLVLAFAVSSARKARA